MTGDISPIGPSTNLRAATKRIIVLLLHGVSYKYEASDSFGESSPLL